MTLAPKPSVVGEGRSQLPVLIPPNLTPPHLWCRFDDRNDTGSAHPSRCRALVVEEFTIQIMHLVAVTAVLHLALADKRTLLD